MQKMLCDCVSERDIYLCLSLNIKKWNVLPYVLNKQIRYLIVLKNNSKSISFGHSYSDFITCVKLFIVRRKIIELQSAVWSWSHRADSSFLFYVVSLPGKHWLGLYIWILVFGTFINNVFLVGQYLDCSINYWHLITKESIYGDLLSFDDQLFADCSLQQMCINSLTRTLRGMQWRFLQITDVACDLLAGQT